MALLVDQSQQVAGLPRQQVQDVLIVAEVDVVPHHALFQVLLLLQLEDVTHKELLELLIGEVNAQLLEAVKRQVDLFRLKRLPSCDALAVWRRVLTCC